MFPPTKHKELTKLEYNFLTSIQRLSDYFKKNDNGFISNDKVEKGRQLIINIS